MPRDWSGLIRDLRHGARALRATPAFAAGAIVTIALAVGAATSIFSVVHGVLLRQLPYRDVDRIFWIWSDVPGRDRMPFNVPDFIDYRDSTTALSGLAGFFAFGANLSDESAAERVQGLGATGNLFDVMGARVRLGRLLQPGDEQADADRVVVLSEPFWQRRFGADPDMVGRTLRLNGESYRVVGVAAGGLAMPVRDIEFVVPFSPDRDPRRGARNSLNFIIGVGRLGGGITASQAASELTGISRRLRERFPVENARKQGVRLVPAIEGVAGAFRTALLTLFAAVGAVLLIACANLANLMLTRATGRRAELAVRLALGASRLAVIRQVLVEALLVSAAGGALGVLAAAWGVATLVAVAPPGLPRAAEIRVDGTVLLFSVIVSSLAGVLFGLLPALASSGVDVREALQDSGRGTTGGGRRIRGALVSAEVALALALLVVMAMLGKSFANVQAVLPGFDPSGVLSAHLTLPAGRFNVPDRIVTFQRALALEVSALPGVTRSGAISLLPLSGLWTRVPFRVEGRTIERERVPVAQYRMVTDGYFEAARIPVKRGRPFSERDFAASVPVAVVNEALARQWLDGLDPVGARLLVDDNDTGPRPIEIVGVVGDVRQMALDGEPTWDLYLPYAQVHPDNTNLAASNMFWIVRTAGDPASLTAGLGGAVRRVDPEVAASQIKPMDRYLADAVAPRRFSLSLMAAFAVAALALAITGIHAVAMYSTSQRAREFAIRAALGATRADIAALIVGHGLRFVLIGLALGMGLALGATRLLTALLFGLAATDAPTYGQAIALVTIVSVLACGVPALSGGRAAGTGRLRN